MDKNVFEPKLVDGSNANHFDTEVEKTNNSEVNPSELKSSDESVVESKPVSEVPEVTPPPTTNTPVVETNNVVNQENPTNSNEIKKETVDMSKSIPNPLNKNGKKENKKSHNNSGLIIVLVMILIIAGGAYYIFFGIKKQELVCKYSKDFEEEEYRVIFKGTKIDKVSFKMTYDLGVLQSEEMQDFKETLKNSVDLCNNSSEKENELIKVIGCKQEIDGDKIIALYDLELKESQDELSGISQVRERMEQQGLTCEINSPQ